MSTDAVTTLGGRMAGGATHGRLPWPGPDDLDDEQRELYRSIVTGPRSTTRDLRLVDARGRLEGPFNAMLLTAPLGSAQQALGAAIRYRSRMGDRLREVAILELARIRRSDFEWYAHARIARSSGLSAGAIRALHDGRASDELDERESLVREVVSALLSERDLDDELYRRSVETLGLRTLAEVVVLVGYYDALALSLRVWRTPLPEDATGSPDSTN